jgi:hypothetical protein
MSGPWSKFKKRIESFWAENLDMVVHCTAYTYHTNHSSYEIPRYWIVLNGEMIWDFPGVFVRGYGGGYGRGKSTDRLPSIQYWLSTEAFASQVMEQYMDCPVANLFDTLKYDEWELGDILRAADRRIGKKRLLEWGKTLHEENPARKVLAARFGAKE